MSDYRDWQHPEGGPPETAPEDLVDVFTAPWLDEPTAGPGAALGNASGSGFWIGVIVVLLVLLLLLVAWRHRRDLVLAFRLQRLERAARRTTSPSSLRELQDRTVTALARWQHGGRAPRRDRLPEPWSSWLRELDHGRFGAPDGEGAAALADRLRSMRRALWRTGGAR